MKIIQTNLSLNPTNEIMDHQARMFEVDIDWETFVEEVKSGTIIKTKNATMPGAIKSNSEIIEIAYDEFHMTVLFNHGTKSLFYAIEEQPR